MARAAVVSLKHKLECLMRFPCLVLGIKYMQVKDFTKKVGELLRHLEGTPILAESRVKQLQSAIEAVGRSIEDFLEAVKSDSVVSDILEIIQKNFSTHHGAPRILDNMQDVIEQGKEMLKQIDFIDRELYKFHSNRDLQSSQEDSRLTYFLEVTRDVGAACRNLRADIFFFIDVGTHQIVLCKDLQFLLTIFEDSSITYHPLNKDIKNVMGRAADFVKRWMIANSIMPGMRYFINTLPTFTKKSMERNIHFETTIKSAFDGDKGIHQYLLQISGEIRSIKRKIRQTRKMNDKTLCLRTLQLGSTYPLKGPSIYDSNPKNIVVGIDTDLTRIIDGITGPPSRREVLAIVGMGGIGKTTLAKQVFNHPRTNLHFHCRAWTTVSHVYRVRNLLLELLRSITKTYGNIDEKSDQDLAEDLYRNLKGRMYLVIMDDVWASEAWDAIRMYLPDDNNGSRIILTSRFTELATYASPKMPHCVRLLDAERSWELLQRHVFGLESCPPELVEFGKQIARKCQGLPLAIVVIAGILSTSGDCWKDVANSVSAIVCSNPEKCLDMLALSYNYLPPHLKPCFLYMGAFPEDCGISVRKLVRLWIAQGFISLSIAEGYMDASPSDILEELAVDYLENLINRSLVLVGERSMAGKIKTCRLHDLLRELCLREAQKENFMNVMKREGQSFPQKDNYHHLVLHLNSDADVHLAPPYRRLQTFLCFPLGSGFVPDVFFSYLKFVFLRVLDIFFLHFRSFPDQIVSLKNLRYLALKVTYQLPASIERLKNLQTLDINGPWLLKEEKDVPIHLPLNLRHLHMTLAAFVTYSSSNTDIVSLQPWSLGCLETLSTLRFSGCTRHTFAMVPHLTELRICETKEDYYKDRSSIWLKNVVCLHKLEALRCSFYKEITQERTLYWDAFPSNLRKLTLSASNLTWEQMTSIARLPNLEVLKLKNYAFRGPTWELTEEVFHCLKQLLIDKTDLVHWEATSDHFPCLQFLVLKSCEFLEELPYGLEEIPTLQLIELHHCSESAETSAKKFKDQIEDLDIIIRNW